MKEVLQAFLADYLRIVEPDVVQQLDLGSLRFPDVAGQIPPDLAGLLAAEVRTSQGEALRILVLIEPEPLSESEITDRLCKVFALMEVPLGRPLMLSFLFLRGGTPGVNLGTAPVCKLLGLDISRPSASRALLRSTTWNGRSLWPGVSPP